MADYYLQCLVDVGKTTSEEHVWITEVLAHNEALFEAALHSSSLTKQDRDEAAIPPLPEGGVVFEDVTDAPVCVDAEQWDGQTILSHDEYLSVEHVITLLQAFLRKFRQPFETISFEWANTCSKMRLDGFGGGACVLSGTDVEIVNTGSWQNDARAKIESRMDASK